LQTVGSESLYFPKTDTKKREVAREKREPRKRMLKEIDRKARIDGLCENRDLLALSPTTFRAQRETEREYNK
jgi:hypothetical protein